ncbi:GntR family transcriptional regulator [Ramlibacter sp.]|uniref:GntR family transcriptional regulator n=1 Tax=Ramlibacter sp. TaxID=1917967 RepID=UPI003D0E938F
MTADLDNELRVIAQTVQSQVWEKLRGAILNGTFRPGERLVEADLCKRLGVSRPSVREALRKLEAEKLVTTTPNKGVSIPVMTWPEACEIYDVRALLEGEASYRCAELADEDTVRRMREALRRFETAVKKNDAAGRVTSTQDFYDAMLAKCGNRVIEEMLNQISARINYLRAQSMSRPGRGVQSAKELGEMLAAIEKKDKRSARAAAVAHVTKARDSARLVFDEVMAAA